SHYEESLLLLREWPGLDAFVAHDLAGLGGLAISHGQPERAARLFAVVDLHWDGITQPPLGSRADFNGDIAAARAQLGEAAFAVAWAEGKAMSFEQAID